MATILVVEDDDLSRDALARRLERRGYRTVTAVDGEQAIAIARTALPDLVLMDLGLPKLDGGAATRYLKTQIDTAWIPIIVLSAHAATDDDRASALAVGGDSLAAKPVDFEALLTEIELLLTRAAAPPARDRRRASPHS